MTPPAALVPSELADLRSIPLQDMPALASLALEKIVQRVLPGRPVQTVVLETRFSSGI